MNRQFSLNIAHKFLAYLTLLSIVPLLVLGAVSYRISSDVVEEEASHYTAQLVYNQRDYLDLQLQQVEQVVTTLSNVEQLRDVLENTDDSDTASDFTMLSTRAAMGNILNGYYDIDGLVSINVFSVSGTHFQVGDTLNTDSIRSDLRDLIFVEALNSNRPVHWVGVVDNINASSDDRQVVAVAKVVYTVNRTTLQRDPIGLIVANFSIDQLYQSLIQTDLGENGYLMVIDTKESIVYHPDRALIGTQLDNSLLRYVGAGDSTTTTKLDGTNMSVSYAHSNLSDWTIYGVVPISTLNAKSDRIQGTMIVAMVLSLIAIALLGRQYIRRVVLPIRDIIQQLKAMQKTHNATQSYQVPVRGNDEIAELSRWFNTIQILYTSSNMLMTLQEVDDLLQFTVNNVVDALSADRVTLIGVDLHAEQITQYVVGGPSTDSIQWIAYDELMEGLAGWAMREGKPALSPKGKPDSRESVRVQKRRLETKCGDILVVPLQYKGKILGTVTAINQPDQRSFTQQDVDLVSALTDKAAIAIDNAQLMQSLRVSETKFVTAFHASPEPMSITSLEDGHYIEVNPSFLSAIKHQRSDVVGKRPQDIGIWASVDDYLRLEQLTAEYGRIRDFEIVFVDRTGKTGVWSVSSETVELDGKPCVLTVSKDLSAHKAAEVQRFELALERERVQILSEFVTKASHEFRTPLSIIGVNAHLLTKPQDIDEREKRINKISDQVDNITTLVDLLILMTRLDSGGQVLAPIRIDLNETTRSVYFAMQPLAKQKQQTFTIDLCDDTLHVKADVPMLTRAAKALVENAIKFTPTEGTITVRLRRRIDNAVLEVIDNGIGIRFEHMERVFERFYQVDSAGTQRGFGLGLPIARKIIDLHEGQIESRSTPEDGSVFRIVLPLA